MSYCCMPKMILQSPSSCNTLPFGQASLGRLGGYTAQSLFLFDRQGFVKTIGGAISPVGEIREDFLVRYDLSKKGCMPLAIGGTPDF